MSKLAAAVLASQSSELAFVLLDRSLRKFKTSNSKFATILSERSKKDSVTTPLGRSLMDQGLGARGYVCSVVFAWNMC